MSSGPIVCLTLLICSSRLKDDDLAGRVGLQVKELNKLMATLEKDGLIQAYAFSLYLSPHKGPKQPAADIVRTNSKRGHNAPWAVNTFTSTTNGSAMS